MHASPANLLKRALLPDMISFSLISARLIISSNLLSMSNPVATFLDPLAKEVNKTYLKVK